MVPCVMTKCGNARWIGPAQSKSVQASLSPPLSHAAVIGLVRGRHAQVQWDGWLLGWQDGFVAPAGPVRVPTMAPFGQAKHWI